MGEEHIIRGENLNYTPDTKGLGYVLYHAMKNNKDAIAQVSRCLIILLQSVQHSFVKNENLTPRPSSLILK